MRLTVVIKDPDEYRSEHWSIAVNGEEVETLRSHYDAYEVLAIAQSYVSYADIAWKLDGAGGFIAVEMELS